jgi:hypothetical protein
MQRACAISSVDCQDLQYLSTFLIKGTTFENELFSIKCVLFIFSTLSSETCFILRTEGDMMKNTY